MSNSSVLAEKVYGTLVARQDKQQMAGIQDATKSVFRGGEHSSSYSYFHRARRACVYSTINLLRH